MARATELLSKLGELNKVSELFNTLWKASTKYDNELSDGSSEEYASSVAVDILVNKGMVPQEDWRDFEMGVLLKKVKLSRNMSMTDFENQLRSANVFESRVLLEYLD